jgi:GR25 family glycosyltransferase involved in LPS biosynthesis
MKINSGLITIILTTISIIILILTILFICWWLFFKKYENNNINENNIYEKYTEKATNINKVFKNLVINYKPMEEKYFEKDITIIIKTFLRPECVLRLINSIRKFYSNIKIIVADDSISSLLENGENYLDIYVVNLPFYSGASKGRNKAVELVKTKYIMLLDDDMYFTEKTDLEKLYNIMENNKDIDLLATKLSDRKSYDAIFENTPEGLIIHEDKILKRKGNITYSHRQLNCFICKTELLKDVKWDEFLKTEEHTEHFYRIFLNGYIVANTTDVEIFHDNKCSDSEIYKLFRNNSFYEGYILNKYNFSRFGNFIKTDKSNYFERALLNAKECLDKNRIQFAIARGTALGYYRERSFIEYDNNINLYIFRSDISNENDIIKALKTSFYLINIGGELDNGLKLSFLDKKTNVKLDISIIYESENYYWVGFYNGKKIDNLKKNKYPKLNFDKVKFLQNEFNIIPKQYLEVDYSDSWFIKNNSNANNIGFLCNESDIYPDDGPVPLKSENFINDFFGKNIWFINLDRRPDRLRNVIQFFNVLQIKNYNRLPAIDGKTDENVQKIINNSNTKITKAEVACTLSHREIWKHIVKNKIPWTLIFEDDIAIEKNINQTFFAEGMIESLCGNNNTQIVFFGYCHMEGKINKTKHNIFFKTNIYNAKAAYCTHCYAITWRGAEKLLKITQRFEKPVDAIMNKFPINIRTYIDMKYNPNLTGAGIVKQNNNEYKSDIREKKNVDFK